MSKSVLISIQPKWCELIASGKKTVEVRKTKPKLQTPFKCYIYCTKDEPLYHSGEKFLCGEDWGNGNVVGEFVCDEITPLFNVATTSWDLLAGNIHEYAKRLVRKAHLTEEEMHEYAKGKNCYAWHISDLVIYDKPKELNTFFSACKKPEGTDCSKCVDERQQSCRALKRPPQSWCYVEVIA